MKICVFLLSGSAWSLWIEIIMEQDGIHLFTSGSAWSLGIEIDA